MIIWSKLSQELLDRFSSNFRRWEVFDRRLQIWPRFLDGLRDVAMATNFMVKIGKIELFTYIRKPGIPKRVALLWFWYKSLPLIIWFV